jgi:hypothetical protein
MSRDRPDGERRRRDQALNCSTVKAPTATTATAISTSWPSHERFGPGGPVADVAARGADRAVATVGPAATAVATIRWSTGHTCRCTFPPPDHHSLPIGASAAAEFASGSARAAPPARLRLVIATSPAVATQTHHLYMSSSPANVIIYVTGAATASEMKAVTTDRTVIRMSDRPVVTFLAAACTGHYP